MKNNTLKKRQFTLIELIIVIVVIGILAGMALPKFMGVQRNAKVSAMFRDIDTLEKIVVLYYQDNDELPLYDLSENTFNTSQTLLDTLNRKGDEVSSLKVINKTKLKNYLSKDTKYGNDKSDDDEYLYSELTGNVYYSQGLKNGDNITYHTYENANGDPIYKDEDGKVFSLIKDVKFGSTLLQSNRTTVNEEPTNDFTGLVTKGKTLKIELNGVDVSTQIKKGEVETNEVAKNSLLTTVNAAGEEFETFTLPATLDKTKVNKVKIKIAEENKTAIFLVDFKGELEAPDIDVDTDKKPYELIVNYPSGVNVSETQYIIDNKETTTTKPDLTPLMDGTTHTIDVRYKTTDNKLSQWANVSFSYSDVSQTPPAQTPDVDESVVGHFDWNNIKDVDKNMILSGNEAYYLDNSGNINFIDNGVKALYSSWYLKNDGTLYRYMNSRSTKVIENVKYIKEMSYGSVFVITQSNELYEVLGNNIWKFDFGGAKVENFDKFIPTNWTSSFIMVDNKVYDISFNKQPLLLKTYPSGKIDDFNAMTIGTKNDYNVDAAYMKDGKVYFVYQNSLLNHPLNSGFSEKAKILYSNETQISNYGRYALLFDNNKITELQTTYYSPNYTYNNRTLLDNVDAVYYNAYEEYTVSDDYRMYAKSGDKLYSLDTEKYKISANLLYSDVESVIDNTNYNDGEYSFLIKFKDGSSKRILKSGYVSSLSKTWDKTYYEDASYRIVDINGKKNLISENSTILPLNETIKETRDVKYISNQIGNSESTTALMTIDAKEDVTLSIDFTTSSEVNDYFYIYVDDTKKISASGSKSDIYNITLPKGNHTVKFLYQKNASYTAGKDGVYINKISITGANTNIVETFQNPNRALKVNLEGWSFAYN